MSAAESSHDATEDVFGGYRLDGLYAFGPNGMRCVLAVLIAQSLLRVYGTTAYGERRAKIRASANEKRRIYTDDELREQEAERRRPKSGHPFYARPVKPATSGRKKKVA